MNVDLGGFAGLIVAILGGAAVGVERQHSGHATGPDARLGGIRTFTLLGTIAGIAGMLIVSEHVVPATLLLAGGIAVIVVGYVRASKKDIDATTEVAAIVVLGAGVARRPRSAAIVGGAHDADRAAARREAAAPQLRRTSRRADDARGGAVCRDVDRHPAAACRRDHLALVPASGRAICGCSCCSSRE